MAPKIKLSNPHRTGSAQLLEELTAVHAELCKIDQCDNPMECMPSPEFPSTLSSPSLIKHRDRAVRVLACACMASLLRIFAPEPPIDDIKPVLMAFWGELKGLAGGLDDALYPFSFFLLESLVTVRSAVLVWELEGADLEDCLGALLTCCFDYLAGAVKQKQTKRSWRSFY